MKKNVDNFDELMKNKLDGMDFSFNEANWEKASQMIDASRPAKKPFGNLLVASSIFLAGALIVGSVYYFSTGSMSSDKQLAQNNFVIQENSNGANSSDAANKTLTNSSTENTSGNSTTNTIENSVSTKENSNSEINSSNSNSSNEIKSTSSKKENSSQYAEGSGKSTVGSSKSVKNSKQIAVSSYKSAEKGSNTKDNTENFAVPVGKTEGAKIKNGSSQSDPQNIATNNQHNSTSEQTKPETLELKTSILNVASQSEELRSTGKEAPFKTPRDYVRIKHHSLSVEAGAINSFGWMANGTRNGNSVNPFAGINYQYHFTSKSSLLIGLQYNSLANLTESNVSFSVTTFDFGMNNKVTTYKVSSLQYAVMPLKFIYKFDKNNGIGIGLNMSYLLNVKNKIETSTSIESNVVTTQTKNDNGYGFDYLNKYNAQLALSYNRKLSRKMGFNVELNKSLMNVFKDYSYFGVANKNSKPASIKLSLTYTLFNK